jgi:hypothetical protein
MTLTPKIKIKKTKSMPSERKELSIRASFSTSKNKSENNKFSIKSSSSKKINTKTNTTNI